jgi:hypothetical protein
LQQQRDKQQKSTELTIKVETDRRVALAQLILCSHLVFASILNSDIFYFKGCKVRVSIFVYPQLKRNQSILLITAIFLFTLVTHLYFSLFICLFSSNNRNVLLVYSRYDKIEAIALRFVTQEEHPKVDFFPKYVLSLGRSRCDVVSRPLPKKFSSGSLQQHSNSSCESLQREKQQVSHIDTVHSKIERTCCQDVSV